ncbi:N-acetylmuramoyl-L-alanine amidase [Kocuria sp.]|uniref:N-acetylmuramoyl-L-alanine amidase n=1 Tax=Kocuria sp. TaxID=1871328 RepID=UPI0026DC7390|nr:peptidoglycan-binding protein [Kocuria sp.]
MTDRRVVGLRERLLRAGATDTAIAVDAVSDPSVFDGPVDRAVRGFQQHKGLIVDGVVGPETESALNDAQYSLGDRPLSFREEHPLHGEDVAELQTNLSLLGFYYGHLDGTFTRQTEYAVRELQSSLGLPADGVVALDTLTGLARVSKKITSSKAFSLRDHRRLESLSEALRDREVILVPSGAITQEDPEGAPEFFNRDQDEITRDVALRTCDLLRTVGAAPLLVDPVTTSAETPSASVTVAGSTGEALAEHPAALVLYLQCDWNRSPQAQGVATFFWGDPASGQPHAPIGELASTMILRELVARTGAQDLGAHGRQWHALRSGGTAAAWVALGYLSHQDEAANLRDDTYRARLAESLLCGLQRVLTRSPESTATGTMSLKDIQSYYRRNP